MSIKTIFVTIISFLIDSIRPFLGPKGCCIHPVTCRTYAKDMLHNKSIFIAIPLIIIRVLSCNPINGIYKRYFKS